MYCVNCYKFPCLKLVYKRKLIDSISPLLTEIKKMSASTFTSAAAASAAIPSSQREFTCVDLSDFDNRRDEIIKTLMGAATTQGFFYGK